MNTLRWVINAVVVGIPFSVFMATACGFNIWANIVFNKWWAGGNVYLMAQTAYMVCGAVFATFLMFEINVILKWAKLMRTWVLISAIVYNFIYTIVMLEWVVHLVVSGFDAVD